MDTIRFSAGAHPYLETGLTTGLGSKGITISPTRPEGTIRGTHYRQQQEEEEHHDQHGLHLGLLFSTEGSSVTSHTGYSNNWMRVHDSCMKPPGGLLYSGQLNQLLKLQGSLSPVGFSQVPIPVDGVRFLPLDTGPSRTTATTSGLPT